MSVHDGGAWAVPVVRVSKGSVAVSGFAILAVAGRGPCVVGAGVSSVHGGLNDMRNEGDLL
jgi:hypothetical protein